MHKGSYKELISKYSFLHADSRYSEKVRGETQEPEAQVILKQVTQDHATYKPNNRNICSAQGPPGPVCSCQKVGITIPCFPSGIHLAGQ